MATFWQLLLCFASHQQGLAQRDCQDDTSILQLQASHRGSTAVSCEYGEEEFNFDDWTPGLYSTGDQPVEGVTITGFTVGPDGCKQPSVVSPSNRLRQPGIGVCNCNALMMANDASPTRAGLLARCQPTQGAPTVELTFDTPRDIVSVTFLNVNPAAGPQYSTTFSYVIRSQGSLPLNSHTVTVPASSGSPSSITVLMENQCVLPQNVEKVTVQFGNNAAFRRMRLCRLEPEEADVDRNDGADQDPFLVGHLPVRPQDPALFQARVQATSTRLTCPHGEEEWTLAEWEDGYYTTGDSPALGVTISGFSVGLDTCYQPAIISRGNSDNREILNCDCKALVVATETEGNLLDVCNPEQGAPRIELTFDSPQDIVSVTFVNENEPRPDRATTFTYEIEAEPGTQSRASHTVTILPEIEESGQFNTTVDISGECVLPQKVVRVTLQFGQRASFVGMKLCKGAASLVGDPHVRTQDHTHYTVLNEGNFLAWRFNSDSTFTGKSGPKKVEVDWRIYAHYSAHRRSWTRGLLLVDQSMGSYRQSFEFTSEECKLRKHVGDEWKVMEASELLQVSEAGDFVTGFNFTHLEKGTIHFDSKKIWSPKGQKARWDVQFLKASPRGQQLVATVQLRCFPGRHIDIQVIRERMADARFVEGQLGHHGVQLKREKNGLGHWFHTSSDHEFQLNASWKDLGGSSAAATFLELEDEKAKKVLTGNPTCSPEEKEEAMKLCKETMKVSRNADEEFLDECVLDICAGGGVAAAELAGDIFSS